MIKITRKAIFSLLLALAAVCFATALILFGGMRSFAETEGVSIDFEGDEAGKEYVNYVVEENDGNKYLKSKGAEFGTTGVLYANDSNEECKNYEISADFMFPEGSSGIIWLFVNGVSAKNDFQMFDIHFENNITRVYATDGGVSFGEIADTSVKGVSVQANKWHTMKAVKAGSLYSLYIDDTVVLEYTYADTDKVPAAIQLMQFLGAGVVYYDNFRFEPIDAGIVELEGLSLTAADKGYAGIAERITAVLSPANANNFDGVEWYVKAPGASEYEKQQTTAETFELIGTVEGAYSVYAKIGEFESQSIEVNIVPVPDEVTVDFEDMEAGAVMGQFTVKENDGNKYIAFTAPPVGSSGNLYDGTLFNKIEQNFELSADFMFPAGTEGILWIYVNGMTAANDFQMCDVHFENGVTHVYAQEVNSLGDIADTSVKGIEIKADTWHNMKVVKVSSAYSLFIDNVKVLSYSYDNTDKAPVSVSFMQYLIKGSGSYVDNFKIKKYEQVDIESVTVTASDNTVVAGENIKFTAEIAPVDANNYGEVEWFVKFPNASEFVKQSATGVVLTVANAVKGEYTVYAKVGEIESDKVKVTAEVPVTSIVVSASASTVDRGANITFTAEVMPVNANYTSIDWYIKAPEASEFVKQAVTDAVLTVTNAAVGEYSVYAQIGDITSETVKVTVKIPVIDIESLSVNCASDSVVQGADVTMSVILSPANANNYDGVEWYVKAPGESEFEKQTATGLTLTFSGSVVGEYSVYAKIGEKTSDVKVLTVQEKEIPAMSVTVSTSASIVDQGADITFSAKVMPENANNYTAIEWYVKAPGASEFEKQAATGTVLTVANAVVGEYSVYAKVGEIESEKINVTVEIPVIPVTSIVVNASALTVEPQTNITFTAKVMPENANNYTVIEWYVKAPGESEFEKQAATGTVLTVANVVVGEYSVYAKVGEIESEKVYVAVEIPVIPVQTVTVTASAETVLVGADITFTAAVLPAEANNYTELEWYVKTGDGEYEKQQETGATFTLSQSVAGTYSVYAKAGGVSSAAVTANIITPPDEITVDFENEEAGKAFGEFIVGEADGNKFLTSPATGFGQSGNLYSGVLGDKIKENFEISADFMFPAGTEGILWLFVNGMTANNDFQMFDVHFANGVTHVYAQDGNSLGDVADTSSLGVQVAADTWHTMKVIKESALFTLYIDDVQVLSYRYADTNNVPVAITLMQFLTNGSGACFDNFTVKKHEVQVVPVESLAITSASAKVSQGAIVTFTAEISPANANTYTEVEWYVKAPGASEYEIQAETGVTFGLSAELTGEYYVYAKVGDKTSNSKYVEVSEKKAFAFVDTSSWGTYMKQDFDNTEIWGEGTGWGGQNNDTFKSNGKGQMQYVKGEPIQVGVAWYGESFPLCYEIAIDVNIAEGSHGTFWFCLENFFGGETGKWTSVGINFVGEKWFAYLTSDTYGEMATSSDETDVKALCGYNKWFTLKMYKYNDGFALYVDDTVVMKYEADATKSLETGIIWLNILSTMNGADDTLLLDNFLVRTDVGESSQQLSVMLAPPASKTINAGDSVLLEGKFFPSTSSVESVEWYMNGTKLDCTSLGYTFTPSQAGKYEFKIVINGVESEILTMTVNAPPEANGGCNGCNGSVNSLMAFAVLPVFAAFVLARRKFRR